MNTRIILFVLGVFLLFPTQTILSQNRSFKSYSIDHGLSQSVINCLYQDSEGYLWIGTQDGVNRYDGYEFEVFVHNPANKNSISNNWIYSITEDSKENIWIATRKGLNRYNKKNNNFDHYFSNAANGLYKNETYGIVTDLDDKLWVNTPPYLNVYSFDKDAFVQFNSGLSVDNSIQDQELPLIVDANNNIWMATTNGLACFNSKDELFIYNDKLKVFNNKNIKSLVQDIDDNIMVGTTNGLFKISSKCNITPVVLVNKETDQIQNNFQSLVFDNNKNLWIGTEDNGVGYISYNALNKQLAKAIFYKSSERDGDNLSHDNVHSLLIDASNNLWLGTLSGLNITDLKPQKFDLYRKGNSENSVDLLDNVIASFYKDDDDKLWVGNWSKGLNIIDRKTGIVRHFTKNAKVRKNRITDDFIHVIFSDSRKNIWIGTRNGINVFDASKDQFVNLKDFFPDFQLPNFQGIRISKIIETEDGIIYVATANGLYQLDFKTGIYSHFLSSEKNNSLTDNLIYDIIEDKDKNLWIATSNGLTFFNKNGEIKKVFYVPEHTNTLCDNFVVSLCEDSNGIIWIGTKSGGVNAFNRADSTFAYYSSAEGLPRSTIYEILEDDEGKLWFTTGSGLALFNTEENNFTVFGVDDGLQSMEFNLGGSYKSKDGEVFFGGMNGFNSFYPKDLKENNYKPNIVLKKVEINTADGKINERLSSGDTIVIPASVRTLNIEFSALEYTNPSKNKYKYMIEGIDNNWVEIGQRRFVPFANLQPGKYTFHVLGSNNDGVWSEEKASLKIIVKPPWWESIFAIISYLIFILVSIFLIIKYREQKIIQEKKILEEEVQKRTIEVVNQKNEIEKSHKQIRQSINYAYRIQEAVLPNSEEFKKAIPDSFIFFQPKDVVSGDFYWFKKFDNTIILAVADCTGHGVPGGFMSMLGISFLNEIVVKDKKWKANLILNELRSRVKTTLKQEGKMGEAKDGMDIALMVIDLEKNEMQFSGANNPLWHVKNNKLNAIKGDKMPIGIYLKEKDSFTNHIISIEQGDRFYMFSDGYPDQFGGENGQKYGMRMFKEKVIEIQSNTMHEQKNLLSFNIERWMNQFKQIDDMVIVGIGF